MEASSRYNLLQHCCPATLVSVSLPRPGEVDLKKSSSPFAPIPLSPSAEVLHASISAGWDPHDSRHQQICRSGAHTGRSWAWENSWSGWGHVGILRGVSASPSYRTPILLWAIRGANHGKVSSLPRFPPTAPTRLFLSRGRPCSPIHPWDLLLNPRWQSPEGISRAPAPLTDDLTRKVDGQSPGVHDPPVLLRVPPNSLGDVP
jgi:hypothetical protein